jgi:hypothetical protein
MINTGISPPCPTPLHPLFFLCFLNIYIKPSLPIVTPIDVQPYLQTASQNPERRPPCVVIRVLARIVARIGPRLTLITIDL